MNHAFFHNPPRRGNVVSPKEDRASRKGLILPVLLLALMIAGLPVAALGRKEGAQARLAEQQRKADYIFMEAGARNALNESDSYLELLRAAYDLDTTQSSVGQTIGYYLMALAQEDSVMALKGFRMMQRHFDLHPEDYYSNIFYGMINNTLGNTDEAIRVWSVTDSLNPDKPDVAIKLVEALQQKGDSASLVRSLGVLDRVERAEGNDLGITSHKIRALLQLRDTVGTIAEVHSLLRSAPKNVAAQIFAGDIFELLGQSDSALTYFNMACATDPDDGTAVYKRAQYYLSRGDSTAYDREISHAIDMENLDIQPKMAIMREYVYKVHADSLKAPQIRGMFESLISQQPHEPQIRDLYASYLVVKNDLRGALEQMEYAVDGDLHNPERWRSIMSVASQLDRPDEALREGRRALEFIPDDPVVNVLMGANLMQAEKFTEAMPYLRKALRVTDQEDHTARSQILASIGDVYYRLEQPDSAFTYYREAVALDPDNLLALNNFAYYLAEKETDLDTAEQYSAICVRANPSNDTAIDTYAWIYYKKKDYEKARQWIDRALEIEADKPQADVLDHAGDIYFMNREVQKAVEFWQRALKLDPDNELLPKKIKQRTPFVD